MLVNSTILTQILGRTPRDVRDAVDLDPKTTTDPEKSKKEKHER